MAGPLRKFIGLRLFNPGLTVELRTAKREAEKTQDQLANVGSDIDGLRINNSAGQKMHILVLHLPCSNS